jgi:hypothetical protein
MNKFGEKLRTEIWHPYLITLYFILTNAVDIHLPVNQWGEAVSIFLILSVVISILMFGIRKTKLNKIKISILLTGALGLLYFTQPIFITINFLSPSVFERVRQSLLLSCIIWAIVSSFIMLKQKKSFVGLNYYLNILLVTLCLWDIGKSFYESILSPEEVFSNTENVKLKPKYNIYLIVPDGSASSKSLKNFWQYENTEFDNYLKQKGFFKAENSHSNYRYTVLTIGSCLNMNYFLSRSEPYIESQIKRNRIFKILNELNYECFMFDPEGRYYQYDAQKTLADYKTLLISQSATYLICHSMGINLGEPRITNTKIFSQFESKIDASKKQFIYMHSMLTHFSYLTNRNWHFSNKNYRTLGTPKEDEDFKQLYLSKVILTNKQIMNTLDYSWDELKNNIVIVMSDHGFRNLPGKIEDANKERYSNYCAVYFPDKDYSSLTDSITPINVMRMVLNKAINAQLEYIPDKTHL